MAQRAKAGDDQPVDNEGLSVIHAVRECKREAEDARRTRMAKSRVNVGAFHGVQDWSHKLAGQSREFLPKVPMAVEMVSAFIKRAMVGFGAWFSVEIPKNFPGGLDENDVRKLLKLYLDCHADFSIVIADAIKVGLLQSLMILKIHGRMDDKKVFSVEQGTQLIGLGEEEASQESGGVKVETSKQWKLSIDLIDPKDYFPDPSGKGLYEIHSVERDLHEVVALAEMGVYDIEAVNLLTEDFQKKYEEWEKAKDKAQDPATPPSFRKKVVVDEFWGTLLDADGRVAERNILTAVANDKFLIRPPQPNPFWHGESPFVVAPLVRVPFSVWHKALFDHATALNFALNEMFNLILDGGIASVWGIKQIRLDDLEDPRQVSGGVKQGATLAVKSGLPHNADVLKKVAGGEVPRDALNTYNLVDREFQAASLVNDLKLGLLPTKAVKATEIIEASQQSAVFFDGVVRDLEHKLIRPALHKAWATILQNADDLDVDDIIAEVGARAALQFIKMSPEERFVRLGQGCKFKVTGLSAILARMKDFQKLMALLQSTTANPVLMQAFLKKYSPDKVLTQIIKTLNINPETIEQDRLEREQMPKDLQQLPQIMQMMGQGQFAKGQGEVPAEVNQMVKPSL